jgi:hypothetical protein
MRYHTIAAYACLIIIGLFGADGSDIPPSLVNLDFAAYQNMSRNTLAQKLEEMDESRINMEIAVTLELRKKDEPKQAKLAAIVIAGCFRFERVSPELAQMIDFNDDGYNGTATAVPLWDRYPAAQALLRIGNIAVPSLLSNLATSNDHLVRELSARSLWAILHAGPAKVALQEEIQRQADAKNDAAVARLMAAMPLLDPPQ